MTSHQFQKKNDNWQCKVCQWEWETRKRSKCPGVIRYEFGAWPNHLKTAGELSRLGMDIPSSPDGCYYQRLEPDFLWLYDTSKAVHLRPSISQYITLLLRTSEKCQQCGCEVEDELNDPHIVDGLCLVCRFEKDWIEQRNGIRTWAQASLHAHRTVLLDTVTTGTENTDAVIEIAVISATEGRTLFHTLIQLQFAPFFSRIWADLSAILKQTQVIICYNADFHRERLIWMAQHCGFALPEVEWQCLMTRYATFYGQVRKDDPARPFQQQKLTRACEQQGTLGGQVTRSLARVQRARGLLQALAKKKGKYYE